jgi:hypothetical protein
MVVISGNEKGRGKKKNEPTWGSGGLLVPKPPPQSYRYHVSGVGIRAQSWRDC